MSTLTLVALAYALVTIAILINSIIKSNVEHDLDTFLKGLFYTIMWPYQLILYVFILIKSWCLF